SEWQTRIAIRGQWPVRLRVASGMKLADTTKSRQIGPIARSYRVSTRLANLLVLLHALESLFKLRDQRSFAGLKTAASHDAPEKIATRVMCIVHGHQIFGGAARHENDDVGIEGPEHECQLAPLLNGVLHSADC